MRKIFIFFIVLSVTLNCTKRALKVYGHIGTIRSPQIKESSGIVQSKKHKGVYWTHNDSGHKAFLYAIDIKGELINRFEVEGSSCLDWEDIAIDDEGFIYIADIGDNLKIRFDHRIYKVKEPTDLKKTSVLKVVETIDLKYKGGAHNAEALCMTAEGELMVITKSAHVARVYLHNKGQWQEQQKLRIKGLVTGADINASGQLAILTYKGIGLFEKNNKGEWVSSQFTVAKHEQCEGICWSDGDLIVTNEQRGVFRVKAP